MFSYQSQKWKKKRLVRLAKDDYVCVECKRYGRLRDARIVHHIKPIEKGGDPWDIDNMESLCYGCHNKKHPEKWKRKGISYKYSPPFEK